MAENIYSQIYSNEKPKQTPLEEKREKVEKGLIRYYQNYPFSDNPEVEELAFLEDVKDYID